MDRLILCGEGSLSVLLHGNYINTNSAKVKSKKKERNSTFLMAARDQMSNAADLDEEINLFLELSI